MEDRRSCRSSHAGPRRSERGGWTARRTGAAAARGAGGAGASAGPAAGGGGAAARTCRTTVCTEITRGAGGVAVWRLRADPHGSSGAARRDGLARTAAEGAVPMQADHGPPGGRGDGYSVASSEGEAAQRHEAVGAEAARRGSDARRRTDGWPGSIPQTRARARQQATREQVEGQGCGGKAGAAALRAAA
jgi:hypothetical protein